MIFLLLSIYASCYDDLIQILGKNDPLNGFIGDIASDVDDDIIFNKLIDFSSKNSRSLVEVIHDLNKEGQVFVPSMPIVKYYLKKIGRSNVKMQTVNLLKAAIRNPIYREFFEALENNKGIKKWSKASGHKYEDELDASLSYQVFHNILIPPVFINIIKSDFFAQRKFILSDFFDLNKEKESSYRNVARYLDLALSLNIETISRTADLIDLFSYLKYFDSSSNFDNYILPYQRAIDFYYKFRLDYKAILSEFNGYLEDGKIQLFVAKFYYLQDMFPLAFKNMTIHDIVYDLIKVSGKLEENDFFKDEHMYFEETVRLISDDYLKLIHLAYNRESSSLVKKFSSMSSTGDRMLLQFIKNNPRKKISPLFIFMIDDLNLFFPKYFSLETFFDLENERREYNFTNVDYFLDIFLDSSISPIVVDSFRRYLYDYQGISSERRDLLERSIY